MTWDDIFKICITKLNLKPWEIGRYTLKEVLWLLKEYNDNLNYDIEKHTSKLQELWKINRWQTFIIIKSLGVKEITSEFQLLRLPGDKPSEKLNIDLLSKLPKTLNL